MTTPTDPVHGSSEPGTTPVSTTLRTALDGGWSLDPLTADGWAVLPPADEDIPEDDPRATGWEASGYGVAIVLRKEDGIRIVDALNAAAALATPAPAADEARCVACGDPRSDMKHLPCGRIDCSHTGAEWALCHPFQPTPTPAPPTPPERCNCGCGCEGGPDHINDAKTEARCKRCWGFDHGPLATPPATEPVAALVSELVGDLRLSELGRDGRLDIVARKLDAIVAAARAEVDVEALAEALDGLPYRDCEMWVNNDIPTAGFAHDLADAYLATRARRAGESRA